MLWGKDRIKPMPNPSEIAEKNINRITLLVILVELDVLSATDWYAYDLSTNYLVQLMAIV